MDINIFLIKERMDLEFYEYSHLIPKKYWKMLDWVKEYEQKLNKNELNINQSAIYYLEDNPNLIDWNEICLNPNAIELLKKNREKIIWENMTSNINGKELIEPNADILYYYQKRNILLNPCMIEYLKKRYGTMSDEDKVYLLLNKKSSEVFKENKEDINKIYKNLTKRYEVCVNDFETAKMLDDYDKEKIKNIYIQQTKDQEFIEKNLDKYLEQFQINPNAIKQLWKYKNPLKLRTCMLKKNKNAGELMEYVIEKKINWLIGIGIDEFKEILSCKNMINYIEKNKEILSAEINDKHCKFSLNEGIFNYDYDEIKKNKKQLNEEIIKMAYNPKMKFVKNLVKFDLI